MKIYLLSNFNVIRISIIFTMAVIFTIVSPSAHASYDDMSNAIPDDNYKIMDGGNSLSGSECAALSANAGSPVCIANYTSNNGPRPATSHQYLMLSGSNIDYKGDVGTYPAKFMDLVIYTKSPQTSKTIKIGFTDRGIGNDRACDGYSIQAAVTKLDKSLARTGVSGIELSGDCKASSYSNLIRIQGGTVNTRVLSDGASQRTGGDFQEVLNTNPNTGKRSPSGVFAVYLRLEIQGPTDKQSAFHLYSTDSSKMGFRETIDEYSWINQYPTAVAKKHTLTFKFRAPCGTPNNTPIPGGVQWDSGNEGGSIQPNGENAKVRIYATKADGTYHHEVDTYSLGNGPQYKPMNSQTYDGGKPFSYVAEFSNIYGGNGISFRYPYESGSFWLECPTTDGWEVKNRTSNKFPYVAVNRVALPTPPTSAKPSDYSIGMDCDTSKGPARCKEWNDYYTARDAAWAANTAEVKSALQRTNFTHFLSNISSAGQEGWDTASTGSRIQYKFKLAGEGGAPDGKGDRNGAAGYGQWDTRYSNALIRNNTGAGVKDNPVAPADGPANPSSYTSQGTYNEMLREPQGDGSAGASDMYCERVLTVRSGNPDDGSSRSSVRFDTATDNYTASVPQCVYLCVNAPGSTTCPPVCEEWSVGADAAQVNLMSGNGDKTDAWVGDKYEFNYHYYNNGPAPQTSTINFKVDQKLDQTGYDPEDVIRGAAAKSSPFRSTALGDWSAGSAEGFNYSVGIRDGGKTYAHGMTYSPTHSAGRTNCESVGDDRQGPLTVTVPYYYDITPQVSTGAAGGLWQDSVEQGETISIRPQYIFPKETNERGNTWTKDGASATQYKITQVEYANGQTPPTLGPQTNSDSNPCAGGVAGTGNCAGGGLSLRGPADATTTDKIEGVRILPSDTGSSANNAPSENLGDVFEVTDTNSKPVGTKLCYIVSISNPIDDANAGTADPTWRHSQMRCITIIKKPKVQFKNGDLTVGRSTQDDQGRCDGNSAAVIQTPRSRQDHQYGSWIEYGAFATGEIRNFGSGSFASTPSDAESYKRLLFANTFTANGTATGSQVPGRYTYSAKCLSNAFSIITPNKTSANEIGDGDGVVANGSNMTLVPGDYFSNPGKFVQNDPEGNRKKDKLGYYTPAGKNLVIGKPVATSSGGGGVIAEDATTGNTYEIKYCDLPNSALGSRWSFTSSPNQASNKSSCGDDAYIKLWLSAPRNQGEYAQWTYTAPANTTISKFSTHRELKSGEIANYRGSWINVGADGVDGSIEYCTNYGPFQNTTSCNVGSEDGGQTAAAYGSVAWALNNTSIQFKADCRVGTQEELTIHYGNPNIQCPDGGHTSYALRHVRVTLKDNKAPALTLSDGGLYKDGAVLNGTIGRDPVSLTFSASDGESGIDKYTLQYRDTAGNWQNITSEKGITTDPMKDTINPVQQFGHGVIGEYTFRLVVWDKAGNQAAPVVWQKNVNTTYALNDDYTWFKGRNIVMYAQKKAGTNCSDPDNGGNITISDDIVYQPKGYTDISELPRIMFLADCNIIIEDGVKQVDAWLVAKEDVRTCGVNTYKKFKDRSISHNDCRDRLYVNGAVQAKRLLLLRTYGSDATLASEQGAAEVFNLRPDQILSTWSRGQTSGVSRPIYEVDLPPNW